MRNSIGILFCIIIAAAFSRCNEIKDCQLVGESDLFVIALFDLDTVNLNKSLEFSEISIDGFATPVLDSDTTLSIFALPVDDADSTITYYFNTELGRDTLVLGYTRQYYIFYEECDPALRIFGLEVKEHTFDSVSIVNRELNDDVIRNIEIFVE